MSRMSRISRGRAQFSRWLLSASAAVLALPVAAQAQSVNYSELDAVFDEPVTTSATGKPQRASDAPAALVIISRDDIRRSPAKDIPGLIRAYAGIDVVRWTGGHADVAIRGGVRTFNPRILVTVDGRQAYLDHFGMANWAGLGVQLDEIQQIEVVRGPNSALFGFNAASGVINIVTINPLQMQQVTVTAEAGGEGYARGSGVAALKLGDRLGLRLSGGYGESEELDGLNTSALASQHGAITSKPKHEEVAGELFVKFDEGTEGRLSVSHWENNYLGFNPALLTDLEEYKFTSVGARISHDTSWGSVSARAFRNWSTINGEALSFRNKVFVASADTLIRAGSSNTLRFGLEYRDNALRSSPGYPGSTRYAVYAGSSMWENQLADAVTFTAAARLDYLTLEQKGAVDQPTIFTKEAFDRSLTEWSFNSALLFKLSDVSSLRIAGGRGIEAPSLLSFGARLVFPIPGTRLSSINAGNPAVDPAKIWSGEIGYMRTLNRNGSRLELTAFYNRTNDVIINGASQTPPRAAPPAFPFILRTTDNVGSYEAYGIEASLTDRFAQNWLWALNYTWTKSDQDIIGNRRVFERPLALDSATPEHKVKAQLSYEQGSWLATVAARYTSEVSQLVATGPTRRGPFALVTVEDSLALDAKLAFKVSHALTFVVAGENLTDAAPADLSPAPAERRIRAGLQARF